MCWLRCCNICGNFEMQSNENKLRLLTTKQHILDPQKVIQKYTFLRYTYNTNSLKRVHVKGKKKGIEKKEIFHNP